ncbi:hypothetical protein [Enterococcus gilvus]|uniref:Uncharacterized protein n=1 Tax=Enterococcus gilvus ATCC BAA-350 TaxID=1158614 RepID=R2V628_9ENTE|nr:hypothetical protein [Enterococcus gilvus]EOI53200.1 hypothetical protein UKC_03993 [Enterococcus gilvus ATCC BAA-350]EOW78447.1 hypothetical protein I592_04040 [Enterococcus gilvus ATCC BAA-350]
MGLYWVFFGVVLSYLLFLVIYLLGQWQTLKNGERLSFICWIITMVLVTITLWLTIETSQEIRIIQQEVITEKKRSEKATKGTIRLFETTFQIKQ